MVIIGGAEKQKRSFMTKSQDMRKPHLCLKQAVGRQSQVLVLVSAVVPSHIFITQPLPQQEKTLTGSHGGVHDLLK